MSHGRRELRLRALGVSCHFSVEDKNHFGEELLSRAQSELERLESKFSAFSSDSIVSKINRCSGNGEFVVLDQESRSFFEYANALWLESKHQFDPSSGILQACYADGQPTGEEKALLATRLALVGWSKFELTAAGARLLDSGMLIDLDNCIRPYAVDCIRRIFLDEGATSALISLDDDIATIGKQPDGANWLVGVKHPKNSGLAITRLKLNNQGYSVRGDFERSMAIDGERFGTALSPIDGHPIPGLLSVGVMADTCLAACGADSIAQLKTEQAALKWLKQLGLPWVAIDRQLQCHGLL